MNGLAFFYDEPYQYHHHHHILGKHKLCRYGNNIQHTIEIDDNLTKYIIKSERACAAYVCLCTLNCGRVVRTDEGRALERVHNQSESCLQIICCFCKQIINRFCAIPFQNNFLFTSISWKKSGKFGSESIQRRKSIFARMWHRSASTDRL